MKTLEFKTSKGSFMLSDENYYLVNERGIRTAYLNNEKQFEYTSFIRLSEITEGQASEIVDLFNLYPKNHYQDYERVECGYSSSIESLQSLLKSKGVYLYENPYTTSEAEQKTFYNPVIFKV